MKAIEKAPEETEREEEKSMIAASERSKTSTVINNEHATDYVGGLFNYVAEKERVEKVASRHSEQR